MGKSYVLRNEQGDPVGYLTQGMHAIYCRIRAAQTDEVIVFLQDGSHRQRRIEHAGEELEWREEKSALAGAVALANGRMSAATGEDARRKWSEMERRKKRQGAKIEAERIKTEISEYGNGSPKEQTKRCERYEIIEGKVGADAQNTCVWPQRRWPPPPCWKTAVYRHGAWDEEKA